MASTAANHPRVTLVLENVKDCSIKSDGKVIEDCKPRKVVEHAVLFNMPYLQGDQEAQILHCLYNLQFEVDNILQLVVGRVFTKQDVCTHALIIRFPSVEALLKFYHCEALHKIASKIKPYVHVEYVSDYVASGTSELDKDVLAWVGLTFLRIKKDVCPVKLEHALHCLSESVDDLEYVKDFSVGSNLFIRDKTYTHALAAYTISVDDLKKLEKNPCYSEVLHDKVLPLSCRTLSLKFLAFKPILCAL